MTVWIDDIYMLSSDSGWIAGQDIYSTSDNWRTYHRMPTPYGKSAKRVRPWKGYLIVTHARKSFYTATDGDGRWQRTPLPLQDFEVDTATGKMWAIDDNGEVVLMEDIDRWKPMGVSALFIIGIHDDRLYCRVNEGVICVSADGTVDNCPLLTSDRALKKPELTLKQGNLLWGYDDKSVYLRDSKGWYRVARPLNIAGLTPDPDRKDRVVVLTYAGINLNVDSVGRIEPYTYQQPLAAFVKPGLKRMEITTYSTLGWNIHKETIGFRRSGSRLTETTRTITKESYDPHIKGGHATKTFPMAADEDSSTRQLSVHRLYQESLLQILLRHRVRCIS